jgi:regulator of sigma E protease
MRVIRFSIGFGPPLVRWTRDAIEYTLCAVPLGGYVHVFGMNPAEEGASEDPRSYQRRPRWARALVIFGGPLFSYLLGIVGYFAFFYIGQTGNERVFHVAEVVEGSAAAAGGLQAGDDIGMLDELRPDSTETFGRYIDEHRGQKVVIKLDRGGELMALSVVLPPEPTDKGLLGIRYGEKINKTKVDVGLLDAARASVQTTWANSMAILSALGRMFTRPTEVELGGPPEIVRQLKRSAERGFLDFVWLLAGLTVMFGLLNLMPIPALDGSKLLLLAVELVTRRAVPARFQLVFHGVGFLLLIGLMIVVSISDLWKMMLGG